MAKRGAGKTMDDYLDLLGKSFRVTWSHKEIWIFGLFAAIASTGSIFTRVVQTIRRIEPSDELSAGLIRQAVEGLPWVLQYTRNLIQLDTTRIILTVAAILLILVLLTLIVLGSQQLLITALHRAEKRKKQLSFKKLFRELNHPHLWQLFVINALSWIAINIILIAASFPLSALLSEAVGYNALVYAAFYLALIPLAFLINGLAMFSMINVIRRGEGLHEAFGHSYQLLKDHWLAALEVGILLYLINLIAPIAIFLAAILFAVFSSIIGFASLSTGTVILMTILSVITLIIITFFLLATTGFIVTFNYSVWAHLMMKLEGQGILSTMEHLGGGLLRRIKR
jgi:hypothetical protein